MFTYDIQVIITHTRTQTYTYAYTHAQTYRLKYIQTKLLRNMYVCMYVCMKHMFIINILWDYLRLLYSTQNSTIYWLIGVEKPIVLTIYSCTMNNLVIPHMNTDTHSCL